MSRKVSGVMAGWLAAVSVALAQAGPPAGGTPAGKNKTLSPYYPTASTVDWSGEDDGIPELLPPPPAAKNALPAAPSQIRQAGGIQPPPPMSAPGTAAPPPAATTPPPPAANLPIIPAAPSPSATPASGHEVGSAAAAQRRRGPGLRVGQLRLGPCGQAWVRPRPLRPEWPHVGRYRTSALVDAGHELAAAGHEQPGGHAA